MLYKNFIKDAKSIFKELDEIRCADPREITLDLINEAIIRAQDFLMLIQCSNQKKLINRITNILRKYYDRDDIAYNFLLDKSHILDSNWRGFKNTTDNSIKHFTYPFYLAFEIILRFPSYKKSKKTDELIKLTKEFYWSAFEAERVSKFFKSILKEAKNSILIQDNYLDESVIKYVDFLGENISVSLLLKKPKGKLIRKLSQCSRKSLIVKSNSSCHDRFVVIDNKKVWHVGTSINTLGLKAGMINLVENKRMVHKIMKDFRSWWDEGKSIYVFASH